MWSDSIQTPFVSSLQLPVRQFLKANCVQTLRLIGLYARRPVRCVPLTTTHCRLRQPGRQKSMHCGTAQQWSCLMFSDASKF
ncbi:hypothetical protein TNCV_2086171 [Trichonephila clavipes]|nr:hypothetical protein TNCV_2086171 [Trichonephila clavipes]